MFKKTMVSLIFTGINFSRFYTRLVITSLHFGIFVSRPALSTIFIVAVLTSIVGETVRLPGGPGGTATLAKPVRRLKTLGVSRTLLGGA